MPMVSKTFGFMSTAQWARDKIVEDVNNMGAAASIHLSGPINSGTMRISAPDQERLDKVIAFITTSHLYRGLFKPQDSARID